MDKNFAPPSHSIHVSSLGQLGLCVARDTHRSGFSVSGRNVQWFMGLVLSGGFLYRGEEESLQLAAGELLLVRPGVYHQWIAGANLAAGTAGTARGGRSAGQADSVVMWAVFQPRPHWGDYLQGKEEIPGFIRHTLSADGFRRTRRCMEIALRSYHDSGPHREKWTMLALERVLLGIYDEAHRFAGPGLHVQRALDFIHKNVGRQLSLEEIAAAASISVSFLTRLFRHQVGMTPVSYVEQLRLRRATELLRNSHYPVAQIATLLGYEHPSYFGRRFRKATGLTPRAYRQAATQTLTLKEKPATSPF